MRSVYVISVLFILCGSLCAADTPLTVKEGLTDLDVRAIRQSGAAAPAEIKREPVAGSSDNGRPGKTAYGRTLKYATSCNIIDSTARGFVHNRADSFTIDGVVWFRFFDRYGDFMEKTSEFEYEFVNQGESEEVEYTRAPSRAETCSFDIAGAIETGQDPAPQQPPSTLSFATKCFIENGVARGWVRNLGDAFEIDGRVWFYFFDQDDRLMGEEDDYEYEFVNPGENEEVEYLTAPSGAKTCSFVIDLAVKRSRSHVTPRRKVPFRQKGALPLKI